MDHAFREGDQCGEMLMDERDFIPLPAPTGGASDHKPRTPIPQNEMVQREPPLQEYGFIRESWFFVNPNSRHLLSMPTLFVFAGVVFVLPGLLNGNLFPGNSLPL